MEVSIFNESTALPFSGFDFKPLHPGVQMGMETPLKTTPDHKTFISMNIAFTFHKELFQAVSLNLTLGHDIKMDMGVSLKGGLGVGYTHTFNVNEAYRFSHGEYRKTNDSGNSRFTPSISLGLGYRFDPNDFESTEVFIQRQYWLEIPYSPGFIPLMSHTNSSIGLKLYPYP
ncbi:hypothetical protein AB1A65_17640 [Muricauda sp. ANG21]|uniref:hypothetical protein n=1 Tax=Allomuricauda sp. ANG21 TaxID=3042468 RepID=UPI0034555BCF